MFNGVCELTVLDGVFSALLFTRFRREVGPGPYSLSVEPADVFPRRSEGQFAVAREKAQKLLQGACDAGDGLLDAKCSNSDEIRASLAAEHPCFSARSYDETIYYGSYQAR